MKKLAALALAALLLAALCAPGETLAQYSPLPARSPLPPGVCCGSEPEFHTEEHCHAYYQSYYGDPFEELECTRHAVELCIDNLPGKDWWRLPDWMGMYELWTDGTRYRIGDRT